MPATNSVDADDTVHFLYEHEDAEDSSQNEVIRLNKKWQYDLDMETFLRYLPKVSLLANVS